MTALTQRARDVAGRLEHCSANTRDEYLHELAGRSAAIISELVERVEGLEEERPKLSNAELRALVDAMPMADRRVWQQPSVLGKQEGEG